MAVRLRLMKFLHSFQGAEWGLGLQLVDSLPREWGAPEERRRRRYV